MWNKLCENIGMFFVSIAVVFIVLCAFTFYTLMGAVMFLVVYSPIIIAMLVVMFLFSLII